MVALIVVLVAAHAARVGLAVDLNVFAFTQWDLAHLALSGLLTHMFVHASWGHLLVNSAFTLAFGTPVARYFGRRSWPALAFFCFFLFCGVLSALGFGAVDDATAAALGQPASDWALVGASGAASGLMGAAVRLMDRKGRLGPMNSPTVLGMSLAWVVINVVFGLTGLTPGTAGAPVAWQAHVIGYFVGLVAIGPFAWLARDHAIAP